MLIKVSGFFLIFIITLELSLPDNSIEISHKELQDLNIHLDKFFDHIESINNSENTFTAI